MDFSAGDRSLEILIDLDRLQEVTFGQVELQRELLEALVEMMRVNLQAIECALAVHDYATISRSAHLLKGAAANIGVSTIQDIASQIEYQGLAKNLAEVPDLLSSLKKQQSGVQVFIANHLA